MGHGDVLGALLGVFGLGGRAGRVCVPHVGREVLQCDFSSAYVNSLLIVRSFQ